MHKKDYLYTFLLCSLLLVIYFILKNYQEFILVLNRLNYSILYPLLIGFIISYLVNLPTSFFIKKLPEFKIRKVVSLLLSLSIILLFLFLVIFLIYPQVVNTINLLVNSLISFSKSLDDYGKKIEASYLKSILMAVEVYTTRFSEYISSNSLSIITSAAKGVNSIFRSIILIFISFVLSIYFILNKEKLINDIDLLSSTYFNNKFYKSVKEFLQLLNKSAKSFVSGQILDALVLSLLCFIGMLIFSLPYPLMISSIIFVGALIPIYGGLIAGVSSAFIICVNNLYQGLFFLIFLIILQQVEGNFIYPKIVGKKVGLPSVYTFMSVTIFGSFFGLFGMLISVPIASTIYYIIKRDIQNRSNR